MTTEAPAVKTGMSEEHKRKLAEGRARARAEKQAERDGAEEVYSRLAAQDSKLDSLMAAITKLAAATPAPAALVADAPVAPRVVDEIIAPPSPKSIGASRDIEACYVYGIRVGPQRERANVRITDPEDERWDGELMRPPFNGDPRGAIEVATVTRVDGEIVKDVPIAGGPCHINHARAFLRQFAAAKAAGSGRPWDVERYWRDKKEEEARLKREGKIEELLAMRTLLVDALKGVVDVKSVSA